MTQKQNAALCVFLFFVLEVLLFNFVDRPVSEYLRTVDAAHPTYINFFRGFTDIGLGKWYLVPSGVGAIICAVLLHLKALRSTVRKKLALFGDRLLFIFVTVAGAGILVDIIKPILGRARPVILLREGFYGFHPFTFANEYKSMPSGHTNTIFAMACVLTTLFPRLKVLWFGIAMSVAISRVMVNAHYCSDVIAGALTGCLAAYIISQRYNQNGTVLLRHGIFPIDKKSARL